MAALKVPPSPGGSPVRSTPPFYPMVDDEIIFGDYHSLASSGRFARIPYFHGHNNYEQGYYVIPAFAQGRNVTQEQTAQFLLESFVCPHSYEARQRVANKVSTWVYRYFGDLDNTRLYPTSGTYHGTELHMILGGSQDASGLPTSQAQKDTTKLFQRAVAAFTDNPKSGLAKLGWPQFDPKANTWIEIAVGNKPKVTFAKPEKYDKLCSTIVMGPCRLSFESTFHASRLPRGKLVSASNENLQSSRRNLHTKIATIKKQSKDMSYYSTNTGLAL